MGGASDMARALDVAIWAVIVFATLGVVTLALSPLAVVAILIAGAR